MLVVATAEIPTGSQFHRVFDSIKFLISICPFTGKIFTFFIAILNLRKLKFFLEIGGAANEVIASFRSYPFSCRLLPGRLGSWRVGVCGVTIVRNSCCAGLPHADV